MFYMSLGLVAKDADDQRPGREDANCTLCALLLRPELQSRSHLALDDASHSSNARVSAPPVITLMGEEAFTRPFGLVTFLCGSCCFTQLSLPIVRVVYVDS